MNSNIFYSSKDIYTFAMLEDLNNLRIAIKQKGNCIRYQYQYHLCQYDIIKF